VDEGEVDVEHIVTVDNTGLQVEFINDTHLCELNWSAIKTIEMATIV
jgi:hypothetical protein